MISSSLPEEKGYLLSFKFIMLYYANHTIFLLIKNFLLLDLKKTNSLLNNY